MADYLVNMIPNHIHETVRISQNDIGRQFSINLMNDDRSAYTIPSGATVKLQGTKPSGLGFTVTGTYSGSVVTFSTTAEMSDENGIADSEIVITSGNNVIGSSNINIYCERNPHPDGTIDSTAEPVINQITALVNRAETAADNAEDAADRAAAISATWGDVEDTLDRAQEMAEQAEETIEQFADVTASATTLSAGAQATASYDNGHFTFGIPTGAQGPQGSKGDKGDTGDTGATPNITVGNVSSGTTASVTKRGTTANAIFDFVMPIYQLTVSDKTDITNMVLAELEDAETTGM